MLAALELGARFTAGAARADAKRFAQVYSPIGILPPDQYLSLVVQGTTGCSFTSCTFCDLYHEPYRVKTALEFEQHLERVRAYLGASLSLRRRSIFLGAANALAAPLPRLIEWFNLLVRELEAKKRGVGAFVDGFTGARRTTGDFQTLAEARPAARVRGPRVGARPAPRLRPQACTRARSWTPCAPQRPPACGSERS